MTVLCNVFNDRWCVYGHFIDGNCVYVGYGELWRAFTRTDRSLAWVRATQNKIVDVHILTRHASRHDAVVGAQALVDILKPIGNDGSGFRRGPRAQSVRCVETGQVYDGPSAAARDHGLSPSTIQAVLSGRLQTAGGYRFERVTLPQK